MELTAVYRKVPEGYIAWVEELPGANTQGSTLAEAQENLIEAAQMVLETNHDLIGTPLPTEFSLREKVSLATA
jgi:predicted RNase H-like HicB family nuclease